MTTTIITNDLKTRAAETFSTLGWPTTRSEEWRYTNLAPLQKVAWKLDDSAITLTDTPATLAGRAALELVFVNGRLARTTGSAGIVTDPTPETIADWERNAMVALNLANAQDGT